MLADKALVPPVKAMLSRFSVEEAIELQSYRTARQEPAGPMVFVTLNDRFEEGVRPAEAVARYRTSISDYVCATNV